LLQIFIRITDRLSSNQKKFIAEIIGTFIVVVLATGSVVLDAKTNGVLGIPFIAFAPFVGVAIGVYLIGKISMAHFNPAVTVGFLITKHITKIQLLYYLTAEIIGALLASLFVKYVIGTEAYLGANAPNYAFPLPLIFGIEILASALLMVVIFAVVYTKGLRGFGGIVIGGSGFRHILFSIHIWRLYESCTFSGSCDIVWRNDKFMAVLDCYFYWNLNRCFTFQKKIYPSPEPKMR
jgi:aquaporin Z